jgi:hypothetical protein
VLGFYTVEGDEVSLETDYFGVSRAYCDDGDEVTGGGFSSTWSECFALCSNQPWEEVGWLAGGSNHCEHTVYVTAFARCADFDPPHQD